MKWLIILIALSPLLFIISRLKSGGGQELNQYTLPLKPRCQLHIRPCIRNFRADKNITFSIKQKKSANPLIYRGVYMGFDPIEPLIMQVQLKNIKANRIAVILAEKDSYTKARGDKDENFIGSVQYKLNKQADNQTFIKTGKLSICIDELMQWIAIVKVETDSAIYNIPFEFETEVFDQSAHCH